MFVYNVLIQDTKLLPKLKLFKQLNKKGHSIISNAFSKSINAIKPSICSFSVSIRVIISSIVRIV